MLKKKTETVTLNGWFPSPSILGHVTSLGLSFFHCKMDVLGVCSAYPARSLGECWNTWDSPLGMSLVLLLSATIPPKGSVHVPQHGRWTAGSPQLIYHLPWFQSSSSSHLWIPVLVFRPAQWERCPARQPGRPGLQPVGNTESLWMSENPLEQPALPQQWSCLSGTNHNFTEGK